MHYLESAHETYRLVMGTPDVRPWDRAPTLEIEYAPEDLDLIDLTTDDIVVEIPAPMPHEDPNYRACMV